MTEEVTQSTPESQAAVAEALQEVKSRSFSGRHPELGRMIKCKFCGLRHRENERKCKQIFSKDEHGNELIAPQTRKGVLGAAMFTKRRVKPRQRPENPTHSWLRKILEARKKREKKNDN